MTNEEKELRSTLCLEKPGEGRKNISVKAGAGGGKTTMLSIRICAQIVAGTPIDKFVIITYTNAAASEIREKITTKLLEVIAEGKLSEEEMKNAETALAQIELMQISTIHSFLFKVLKEHAFESGIVLDAQLIDDDEDYDRKVAFFDKWYHQNFHQIDAFSPDWSIVAATTGKVTDHTREVFENMFMDLANVREQVVVDVSDHSADFLNMAISYIGAWLPALVSFKNQLLINRPNNKDGSPKKLLKDTEEIIDNICFVEGLNPADYNIEAASALSRSVGTIGKMEQNDKPYYGKGISNLPLAGYIPVIPSNELDWNFEKLYEKFLEPSRKAAKVVEYVDQMRIKYQEEIDANTLVLSNDEILYRAEKLLNEHPEILDELRTKYSKIYVDEFQDTTGLQTRIVKLLSEKTGTKLDDNDLSEDKLLVVGDPKQSIYRFTGAEKAVYDQMDNMFATIGKDRSESVTLDSNFRSNKDIVNWVNDSFSKLMGSAYTDMDSDWIVSEQKALHGVYGYESALEDYGVPQDAEAVASLVKKLISSNKFFVEEFDRRKNCRKCRCIKPSDIMIVCKNTTNMSSYVDMFSYEGIPVNVQGKFDIDKDEVLKNFVILVSYFGDNKNKHRRVAAAQVVGGIDVGTCDKQDLKDAEQILYDLRDYFANNKMSCAAILQYLMSREDLFLPKEKEFSIPGVKSYRIRLHQMVENTISLSDGDLSSVASRMRNYLETKMRREIPLESNENAVRLMNAHQSKGLTGQIVIIADRSASEGCRYSGFKKAGYYYPAVRYSNGGFGGSTIIPSFGHDTKLLSLAYEEESEEAIRLQYVAATRAAHALIIMPVASSRTKPWFTNEAYGIDGLPDINQWIKEREAGSTTADDETNKNSNKLPALNIAKLQEAISATNWEEAVKCQYLSVSPSGLEPETLSGYTSGQKGYIKEDRPCGNIFGDVLHRVFELAIYRFDSLSSMDASKRKQAIERIIRQAVLEKEDELDTSKAYVSFSEYLCPIIDDYLDRILKPILDDSSEIYPEYEFSFYVPEDEINEFVEEFGGYLEKSKNKVTIDTDKIWVNGKSDLVVKKADGTISIYDFKSDEMNGKPVADFEKDMAFKYEGQLKLYSYACKKCFAVDKVTTQLIHLYM